MTVKHAEMRAKILAWFGGRCQACWFDSYPEALELHHVDPATKHPDFRHLLDWPWEEIEQELGKCKLLCCNCHRHEHYLNPRRGPQRRKPAPSMIGDSGREDELEAELARERARTIAIQRKLTRALGHKPAIALSCVLGSSEEDPPSPEDVRLELDFQRAMKRWYA